MKFHRQVGSGAFGGIDPTLKGDVTGDIGKLLLLFEAKSWLQVDGRGARQVSFSIGLLDKLEQEALSLGRFPFFIYHPKGAGFELFFGRYDRLHQLLKDQARYIAQLEAALEEQQQ